MVSAALRGLRMPAAIPLRASYSIWNFPSTRKPSVDVAARPEEQHRRDRQDIRQIPQHEQRDLAVEGGAREAHGMQKGKELGDPQPMRREPLFQRKENIREEKERREEESVIKAEQVDVRDPERKDEPDRGEEQTRKRQQRQYPKSLRQRRETGGSDDGEKAAAVDKRARQRPQDFAGEHVVGLDRGRPHCVVGLLGIE